VRSSSHVQRLSLSHHDKRGSTDATYRIRWDANAIQNVVVTGGASLLTLEATLVGIIVLTGVIDATLARPASLCSFAQSSMSSPWISGDASSAGGMK
jgi:ABC-type multidrug transport system fused ATPase/permease subunit